MFRGHSLANRCCLCCSDGELVDHLFLHCPVTHIFWIYMLQVFDMYWVMLDSVAGLLLC